jgi:ribosome-binding ATPase YchF (GTP1/OBG family)
LLERIGAHLDGGKPANTLNLPLGPDEKTIVRSFCLLTDKPTILAANVKEDGLADAESNPFVTAVKQYAASHHQCEMVVMCAQLESDLADLSPEEGLDYMRELHLSQSGLDALIRGAYHLLGLRTFFTFNEKEVRAWTIHQGDTAVKAAGAIHSDMERGFIKAETVHWEDLVQRGSVGHARETGHYRLEGRDYVVRDGDVLLFKFSV